MNKEEQNPQKEEGKQFIKELVDGKTPAWPSEISVSFIEGITENLNGLISVLKTESETEQKLFSEANTFVQSTKEALLSMIRDKDLSNEEKKEARELLRKLQDDYFALINKKSNEIAASKKESKRLIAGFGSLLRLVAATIPFTTIPTILLKKIK